MNDTEHRWRKCLCICLLALFIGLIGIVLPEVETGAITYINASNVSQVGLASFSCSAANISDINSLNCTGNEGTTPWYIDVNFTNVTNFSYTESKLKYFSTVGQSTHINDIEIFCETEGEFIDLITFTNEEDWFYFTRNFPDSMHFIRSDGNVTIRYNHTENGNTNHVIILDTVRLIIKPTFEQNIINLNQTIGGGTGTGSQNLSQVLTQGDKAINQSINFTDTSLWLKVGYNPSSAAMEINPSGTLHFRGGSTLLGFVGNGYFLSSYNDQPMRFGSLTANHSRLSYNTTYGTTWLGVGNSANRLNITNFDKVNMYQDIDMSGNNIDHVNVVTGNDTYRSIDINQTTSALNFNRVIYYRNTTQNITINTHLFSYVFNRGQNALQNANNLVQFWIFTNNSATTTNFFQGVRTRGEYNTSTQTALALPCQKDDELFRVSGASIRPNGAISSQVAISYWCQEEWNNTANPTYMTFSTTDNNSLTITERLRIYANGSIQIKSMAGSSKTYLCQENGFITAGTPGC